MKGKKQPRLVPGAVTERAPESEPVYRAHSAGIFISTGSLCEGALKRFLTSSVGPGKG